MPAIALPVRVIGIGMSRARDAVAHGLIRLRIGPNALTVAGTVLSVAAGLVLARGGEQSWEAGGRVPASFWAGWLLFAACAMDMLDGAVARLSGRQTAFGGILDSTLDRVSDVAIFGGMGLAYGRLGNLTFEFLSLLAISNAVLISYVKARAEKVIAHGSAGYWQRGERMVGILVACFAGHVSTCLLMMAVLPAFTVARRLWHSYLETDPAFKARAEAALCRWGFRRLTGQVPGRTTWLFFVASAAYILILAVVRAPTPDPLAGMLGR